MSVVGGTVTKIEVDQESGTVTLAIPPGPNRKTDTLLAVPDSVQSGGAGGTRTPYLGIANAALSQMSYSPRPCGGVHRGSGKL